MVFSSIIFLFTFLPITLGLYFISPRKFKNLTLLIISLVFYAWGEPLYIFLMLFTTIFDFFMGKIIAKNIIYEKKAKYILIFTVAVNIFILGFFKYYGFLVDNLNALFSLNITKSTLPLPIGISFYTFQTLSYIIDVYLGKVKVQKDIISFSLYVTMFSQLVAGPIVRYSDINSQLEERQESFEKFGEGVERFILGLGKKVILANNIGFLWTTISSGDISNISVLTSWIGIIAFTFQIYFDFSGYSDMAIGLGKMFGFDFIENFNYPYTSKSVTEFWRRWHISLGSWFREYIYIPLGGNRCTILHKCRNIFIVWLVTGLWHGASWNFVIWGLYYGSILLIEKLFLKDYLEKLNPILSRIYTMFFVIIGWVLFGFENLSSGIQYLKTMFLLSANPLIDDSSLYYLLSYSIIFIILILCSTPLPLNLFKLIKEKTTLVPTLINVSIIFLSVSYLVTETYNPFLYFRF